MNMKAVMISLLQVGALAAQIPASIDTVKDFNAFLEENAVASAEEAFASMPQSQIDMLYQDFLKTIGSINDDGNVLHILPRVVLKERFSAFSDSILAILKLRAHLSQPGKEPMAHFGITSTADWSRARLANRLNHNIKASAPNTSQPWLHTEPSAIEPSDQLLVPEADLSQASCGVRHSNHIWNQGLCGACYIFATMEMLRYDYQRRYGEDPGKLSVQFCLDCFPNGCKGGNSASLVKWIIGQGGVPTEEDYGRYVGRRGHCRKGVRKAVIPGPAFTTTSEREMYRMLCSHGPFAIYINAKPIYSYRGGVLTPRSCPGSGVNHVVLVVGMTYQKGTWAWIVQNSWGRDWGVTDRGYRSSGGDGGFFLLKYDSNTCNMATQATFLTSAFSVGGRHPWTHKRPLLTWRQTGEYDSIHFESSGSMHNNYVFSLAKCEAKAEEYDDMILAYTSFGFFGKCVSFSGSYSASYYTGSGTSVYQRGNMPAMELMEDSSHVTLTVGILVTSGIFGFFVALLACQALPRVSRPSCDAYTKMLDCGESVMVIHSSTAKGNNAICSNTLC